MQEKAALKQRILFYLLIVVTLVSLIVALVTLYTVCNGVVQGVSLILFCVAGGALIAQIACASIFMAFSGKTKVNSFAQWCVSLEVVAVTIVFAALLPLALVMWLVDIIREKRMDRDSKIDI